MPTTRSLNYRDGITARLAADRPAIRCSDLLQGNWGTTAPAAARACAEDGFLNIELDGASTAVLDATLGAMRGFFALDEARKALCTADADGHGWSAPYLEPAYQQGTVANVESFDVVRSSLGAGADVKWPGRRGFRRAVSACWRRYAEIGAAVLELLARTTELRPDRFAENCGSGDLNTLRLLHYAAAPVTNSQRDVGIAAHTDFECITLLYQSAPGLELRRPDGHWVDAPLTGNRLVVLFGDMLESWTNGRIAATGHRVRRTPDERFSIVMFVAVDPGIVVAPLDEFGPVGDATRYAPVAQEEHIAAEIARAKRNAANPSCAPGRPGPN